MLVKDPQSSRQFRASSKSLPAEDLASIEFCFTKAGLMVIGGCTCDGRWSDASRAATVHSYLSVMIGSTRAARMAGTRLAASAIATTIENAIA